MLKYLINIAGRLHRGALIAITFIGLIVLGTILFYLPISTTDNIEMSLLDALFMSVSCVSVTGFNPYDLYHDFTIFGQLVILFLIQVGGLGIMTTMTLIGVTTGRRIRLEERLLIRDSFNLQSPSGTVALVKKIFLMTFICEFIAGTLLAFRYYFLFGPEGIYIAYWYAVSDFTNAGLDLLSTPSGVFSMTHDNYTLIVTIITMSIGGVGFIVVDDMIKNRKWSRFSLNTKLVLTMEAILIPAGFIGLWCLEGNNPDYANMDLFDKSLNMLFMSLCNRLAGYTTFDMHDMAGPTMFFLFFFMCIGSAPVSTGNGIKTTTIGIVFMSVVAWVRGKNEVVIFHREVDPFVVRKAANCFTLSISLTLVTIFLTFLFQDPSWEFKDVLFEAVAAYSTIGYSSGLTAELNTPIKFIFMVAMFIGRISVMALALMFAEPHDEPIKYPKDKVVIG